MIYCVSRRRFSPRDGEAASIVCLTVAAQPTTLRFDWAVLLLGQSGPNIEWVIHFDLRNTRCEKFITDRADELRHSCLAPVEFAETITNMAAATKQQPTMAHRTFMIALLLDRAKYRNKLTRRRFSGYQRFFQPLPNLARQPFPPRTSLTISNRITAPMVASMITEIVPDPRWMPSCGSCQPPTKAPATPIMRSPISPKPVPSTT
jgi:hypothetical protein